MVWYQNGLEEEVKMLFFLPLEQLLFYTSQSKCCLCLAERYRQMQIFWLKMHISCASSCIIWLCWLSTIRLFDCWHTHTHKKKKTEIVAYSFLAVLEQLCICIEFLLVTCRLLLLVLHPCNGHKYPVQVYTVEYHVYIILQFSFWRFCHCLIAHIMASAKTAVTALTHQLQAVCSQPFTPAHPLNHTQEQHSL